MLSTDEYTLINPASWLSKLRHDAPDVMSSLVLTATVRNTLPRRTYPGNDHRGVGASQ